MECFSLSSIHYAHQMEILLKNSKINTLEPINPITDSKEPSIPTTDPTKPTNQVPDPLNINPKSDP